MNRPLLKEELYRLGMFILFFLNISYGSTNAQGCDFLENDSIQLNISNQNTAPPYIQQYALTTSTGTILAIQSAPLFPPQPADNYFVYAVNYDSNTGVTGFTIGNNISSIAGSCLATTSISVKVCVCSTDCHSTNGTVVLSLVGANSGTDYTQSYALTDNSGTILAINTNPASLNPLFSGLSVGSYEVYALNYETASGINNYSIGENIINVNSSCLDMEGPICYNICANTVCHSEDGTISVNNSGANQTANFTQSYALVDTNGIIQSIKNNPSTTQPLFIGVLPGTYQVYALNYETASGINNLSVGNAINSVTGTCLDMASSASYKVCPCPFTGCNSSDGVISFRISGQNETAGFTQGYALTDTFGIILQTSIAPNSTDSIFEGIVAGYYHIYAINYETAQGITGLSAGNNIAAISSPCFDITGAFCYQVCNGDYDFGDLPDNSALTAQGDYQTLLANNGPRHLIINGLSLGDTVDAEVDGVPDVMAQGDGTDEEGLMVFSSLNIVPGMDFRLPFNYINTTGDTAYVKGWIDWNGDGDFEELNELVLNENDGGGTNPFANIWEISIPVDAIVDTYIGLRLRISLQEDMLPYGLIKAGEVEDYLLYLKCPKVCLPIEARIKRQ